MLALMQCKGLQFYEAVTGNLQMVCCSYGRDVTDALSKLPGTKNRACHCFMCTRASMIVDAVNQKLFTEQHVFCAISSSPALFKKILAG